MKAVVYDRYGPAEVLRIEEVERPEPGDDEVLVKVHATTVTRTDSGLRSAEYVHQPLLHRFPPTEAEDPRHGARRRGRGSRRRRDRVRGR